MDLQILHISCALMAITTYLNVGAPMVAILFSTMCCCRQWPKAVVQTKCGNAERWMDGRSRRQGSELIGSHQWMRVPVSCRWCTTSVISRSANNSPKIFRCQYTSHHTIPPWSSLPFQHFLHLHLKRPLSPSRRRLPPSAMECTDPSPPPHIPSTTWHHTAHPPPPSSCLKKKWI